MQEPNLQFADIKGAHITPANIKPANITGAKWQKPDIRGADIKGPSGPVWEALISTPFGRWFAGVKVNPEQAEILEAEGYEGFIVEDNQP